MSYRRTWLLVDEMNRCWRDRLVETMPGGGKARGARPTETGATVLAAPHAGDGARRRLPRGETLATLDALLRTELLPPAAPLSD